MDTTIDYKVYSTIFSMILRTDRLSDSVGTFTENVSKMRI